MSVPEREREQRLHFALTLLVVAHVHKVHRVQALQQLHIAASVFSPRRQGTLQIGVVGVTRGGNDVFDVAAVTFDSSRKTQVAIADTSCVVRRT